MLGVRVIARYDTLVGERERRYPPQRICSSTRIEIDGAGGRAIHLGLSEVYPSAFAGFNHAAAAPAPAEPPASAHKADEGK